MEELFILTAGSVARRNHYAQPDTFEFQFIVSSEAVNISAWGKDAVGTLTTAHQVVSEAVNPF